MDRNPFHDAPAIHTHQNCSYCHRFQRCEFKRLQRCGRCSLAFYCSKECQITHWPEHKLACKHVVEQDKELATRAGIPHAYTDLLKWVEFYATPIKNCLVAALNLPEFPHQERRSILALHITHKGDPSLPIQHRFTIDSIDRWNRDDTEVFSDPSEMLDSADIRQASEFGRMEMGKHYYGTTMFMVQAKFAPLVYSRSLKCFSIDKSVARAKVISGPWWPPLRNILENGKKMKFCCGKIEGVGCCCGGWVHEENAKKGDPWR